MKEGRRSAVKGSMLRGEVVVEEEDEEDEKEESEAPKREIWVQGGKVVIAD